MSDSHTRSGPFALDTAAPAWVESTLERLSPAEKLAQLFNLRSVGFDESLLERQQGFGPGGITRVPGPDAAAERDLIARFNAAAPVPLLVSADLEGSRMSLAGGIEVLNPLGLAAVDDVEATFEVSRIMAEEARERGINWSFTPVLDINAAFRSAIVATRGFGSNVATIEKHALAQIRAFQQSGVAATVKHWPGEGYDDRDQHLVTTVNPLSRDEWEQTFGRLYRAAIGQAVMSVMPGHIAVPSLARANDALAGLEAFRPASISRTLNQVLREKLGFEGLIVSDATGMAGLGSWSSRADHLPEIIASGCDVILFSNDLDGDVAHLRSALDDGRLGWDRVDDAVRRQLIMKAALGLHTAPRVKPPNRDVAKDRAIAAAVTRRAPTLVKDVQHLLPLVPDKHRRVLVFTPGIVVPFTPEPIPFVLPEILQSKGFEVTVHQPGDELAPQTFDLVLYLFGEETLLTRGRIFLDWLSLTGDLIQAMERHWHDVPTLMISFGYPYLLYDAPRVPTYINAYCTTHDMQAAVADALTGEIPWNKNSPIDPFCGLEDARY